MLTYMLPCEILLIEFGESCVTISMWDKLHRMERGVLIKKKHDFQLWFRGMQNRCSRWWDFFGYFIPQIQLTQDIPTSHLCQSLMILHHFDNQGFTLNVTLVSLLFAYTYKKKVNICLPACNWSPWINCNQQLSLQLCFRNYKHWYQSIWTPNHTHSHIHTYMQTDNHPLYAYTSVAHAQQPEFIHTFNFILVPVTAERQKCFTIFNNLQEENKDKVWQWANYWSLLYEFVEIVGPCNVQFVAVKHLSSVNM